MQTTVTVRNDEVKSSHRDYAQEKADKLARFFGPIHSLDVILDKEHDHYVAEIKITAGRGGHSLFCNKKHKDLAAAIDFVVDKMERQLLKLKEKVRDHRKTGVGEASSSDVMNRPAPEAEETYEDIVDKKEF